MTGFAADEQTADEHLGDLVAGIVDDALPPADRERVLSHLVACPTCRSVVDAHRSLRARLAAAAPPVASNDLMVRLLAVGAADGAPTQPVAAQSRVVRPAGGRGSARTATSRRGPRMSRRRTVASTFSVLALSVGVGMIATGTAGARPTVPSVQLVDQHVQTTGQTTFGDPIVPVSAVLTSHR